MRRFLKLIASPILLVLLVEGLFQAGIWEALAKPESHAGASVQRKRALGDASYARIDYVTLGSSRPEYGIDHEQLAALAAQHGTVHANLSMPGSHWMTIRVLTEWLARHHPEIRGGVIALAVQDFLYTGNGAYELGIVYPFRTPADAGEMAAHVPFDRNDPATWGLYSALFEYREDVQDFVRAPFARLHSLGWWRTRSASETLRANAHETHDMCAFGLDSLAACDRVAASTDERADDLRRQCQQLRGFARDRADLAALARQSPVPAFMQQTRDTVRALLRGLRWPKPPVVVLMPVPRVWTSEVSPVGLHHWALEVLRPLVEDGTIRLIDATELLDDGGRTDCTSFFDFYHQNDAGRARLMAKILPEIESLMHAGPTGPSHRP